MPVNARFMGALALAAGSAAAALLFPPAPVFPAVALTLDDPVLFFRPPMGGADLSPKPKKDGMGMDYLPVRRSDILPLLKKLPAVPAGSNEKPLFWRDPMGGSEISLSPKKNGMGMDFLPVRAADLANLLPPIGAHGSAASIAKPAEKRILYYRNPMGLPDISRVPKKDPMGMNYVPVYEGEGTGSSVVHLSPGKVQRTGVRSQPVEARSLAAAIHAPGTIQLDERLVTVVAPRSVSFIEKVANVTTGDRVKKGQVMMRLYSPEIAAAAAQYLATPNFAGARTRLENLDAPASVLAEIDRAKKVPLAVDWPAPRDGIVMERKAVDGMKADAGQTLFTIADLTHVWALIDVSEGDYERVKAGQEVTVHARGVNGQTFAGRVSLIYPEINRATRTARVRVELDNPDLILRPEMYVEATIVTGGGEKVLTVPESAIIDSGTSKLVLLDLGNGRFEPRAVKTGFHGQGEVEIREGVVEGDKVVTAANFLIDAESNLKAALQALSPAGASQ
ncbi:efflux RND transporter periplasmic adaptor subunit [Rhodoblastus sp.]|uniref:efflux RND transporter periplasmic adaptor subunit n=1 Tax=Rhodoblastus sp. TaxID=1962975 RepID=UPI0026283E00|nr:efflux RND transporter periplasmic adaptor subunit [Rhodoblastus sp.]